jgi:hypothetical protein
MARSKPLGLETHSHMQQRREWVRSAGLPGNPATFHEKLNVRPFALFSGLVLRNLPPIEHLVQRNVIFSNMQFNMEHTKVTLCEIPR